MGKMLTAIFFIVMAFIFFSSFTVAYETPECAYGTFDAWYSKDGIEWQNTTVDHAELKRGEPFYIKATITTKIDLPYSSIEIWEVGEDNPKESSFEMMEGMKCFFDSVPLYNMPKGNASTYVWKMRVKSDTDWAGGTTPLSIRAQFNKNDDEDDDISFTAVNVYILDELWEGYTGDDNGNDGSGTSDTPGFELVIVLAAVSLLVLKRRKS